MADLKLNNEVKNITYPFYLKGDDFKELSLKALTIKKMNWWKWTRIIRIYISPTSLINKWRI
ncbi:hypothetical protein [Spiroplasma endosymbiont of Seladonia tumulorum]|uniref:hypothetical protein n=1 Tax=Spiroplasma endosymbiont of Seladonia tumulorum TaxID=3066321 RepID=UPI0030D48EE7